MVKIGTCRERAAARVEWEKGNGNLGTVTR